MAQTIPKMYILSKKKENWEQEILSDRMENPHTCLWSPLQQLSFCPQSCPLVLPSGNYILTKEPKAARKEFFLFLHFSVRTRKTFPRACQENPSCITWPVLNQTLGREVELSGLTLSQDSPPGAGEWL